MISDSIATLYVGELFFQFLVFVLFVVEDMILICTVIKMLMVCCAFLVVLAEYLKQ